MRYRHVFATRISGSYFFVIQQVEECFACLCRRRRAIFLERREISSRNFPLFAVGTSLTVPCLLKLKKTSSSSDRKNTKNKKKNLSQIYIQDRKIKKKRKQQFFKPTKALCQGMGES